MNWALERQKIHAFIDRTDERMLKIMTAIVNSEEENEETSLTIPAEHLEEIRLGQEDIRNGKTRTSREVREKALAVCMK